MSDIDKLFDECDEAVSKRDEVIWEMLRYVDEGNFPQELNDWLSRWKNTQYEHFENGTLQQEKIASSHEPQAIAALQAVVNDLDEPGVLGLSVHTERMVRAVLKDSPLAGERRTGTAKRQLHCGPD